MSISLQDSAIKKIFREHFKGETPIIISHHEQKVLISNIKDKLNAMEGFYIFKTYSGYTKKELEQICCFKIISSSQYYRDQDFCLKFNKKNELIIEDGFRTNSPVYQLEQIYTLGEKMKLEYKRLDGNYIKKQNEKLKKQKIKELKHKAIIAKINQITREDKFEFQIREYATKVKLLVRLGKVEHMAIDIPYNKFQETLKKLRTTIQTIQELHDSGLRLKIHQTGYRDSNNWKSYK